MTVQIEDLFCFKYKSRTDDIPKTAGWSYFDLQSEFQRMGVPNDQWQLMSLNLNMKHEVTSALCVFLCWKYTWCELMGQLIRVSTCAECLRFKLALYYFFLFVSMGLLDDLKTLLCPPPFSFPEESQLQSSNPKCLTKRVLSSFLFGSNIILFVLYFIP